MGDALVAGEAEVYGHAHISGERVGHRLTAISGTTHVYERATVFGRAQLLGSASVHGSARVSGERTMLLEGDVVQ